MDIKLTDRLKQWTYYIIIGIVSLIALVFLPMLGSTVGLNWALPNTTVGWVVWIATKLIIAILNVLIFHCFMEQAKVNVADDPNFKEANEILVKIDLKEDKPLSPKQWNAQQYGKKGVGIFTSTALSTLALTQAILSFDWVSFLTYLFTIAMGLVWGVLQMKTAEAYWTIEYWKYAKLVEKEQLEQNETTTLSEEI